jgi:Holliday junction DNA helicase RuvB
MKSAKAAYHLNFRPTDLDDFVGQQRVKDTLLTLIEASRLEASALPHILVQGPAGHGKTTLANIAATMTNTQVTTVLAPSITLPTDLTSPLKRLKARSVFFIDEIHRLKTKLQEVLYPVMEDYIIHEESRYGSSREVLIQPFCLIGATTNPGLLTKPLRDRFQVTLRLEEYTKEQMTDLVVRSSERLNISLSPEGSELIALRCRNSPRQANNILSFCRRVALVAKSKTITDSIVEQGTKSLGIDELGLTPDDRLYLNTLMEKFNGGPTGVQSLAHASDLDIENITGTIESHLLARKLVDRTSRGRKITDAGVMHLALHLNY